MTRPEAVGNQVFLQTGSRLEQNIRQPYRQELQAYLSTLHQRLVPEGHPTEIHKTVEAQEAKAAQFLQASDTAARFVARPEFQALTAKEKKELRGRCVIALTICIDGRIVPVLIGSPVFDIAEAKAGLMSTDISGLYGTPRLSSERLAEAIIDRPHKEDSKLVQINTGHLDILRRNEITCAAVLRMIENRELPVENAMDVFKDMLLNTGKVMGDIFNRSARENGKKELPTVAATAMYDTRTGGFIFEGPKEDFYTTALTKHLLRSGEMNRLLQISQPDVFRHNFTDPATLLSREQAIYDIEKYLLQKSELFKDRVDLFIEANMADFDFEQAQGLKFMIAHNIAFQYTTGLYHGGEHAISTHNEQYASFSPDGIRVGQFDPSIQSFGATVSNHKDTLEHAKIKIGLMQKLGKAKPPYILFLSKTQPEGKVSFSSDRNTKAELATTLRVLEDDPEIADLIRKGQLAIIPVILEERTGIVKGIPNLALAA